MKIAQSTLNLSSTQISINSSTSSTNLRIWDNNAEKSSPNKSANGAEKHHSGKRMDLISISPKRIEENRIKNEQTEQKKNSQGIDDISKEWYGDIRLKIFKDLVEMFTGREIKVYTPEENATEDGVDPPETPQSNEISQESNTPQSVGWGIDYQYKETHYTKEGFTMNASGSVVTESGAKISFDTTLSMSRESYEELSVSLKAGDALIDPLMINFSGAGVKLSDQKFKFDLTMDGIEELISAPLKGSGFLAYDKNGDGIINDGSELFGPSSGNGFAELSALDDDKNGWIDENDKSFSNLRVWEKGPDGTDTISKLLDRNVGAIFTGNTATNYNMIDSNNNLTGAMRQSGVWLNEKTGMAGVISEVDLVA
jgi:hypothetical protein